MKEPRPRESFLHYWSSILRRVPELWWKSVNRLRTIVAVLILIAAAFNKQLGRLISETWQGIPGKYVLLLIGLFLLWEVIRAIYEQDTERQDCLTVLRDSTEAEIEHLRSLPPDIDMQLSNPILQGGLGNPRLGVFFHVALTLKAPREVLIQSFSLTSAREGAHIQGSWVDDVSQWQNLKIHAADHETVACFPVPRELKERGNPVDGWLHFEINAPESELYKSILIVKVHCANGTCCKQIDGARAFPDSHQKGTMINLSGLRQSASRSKPMS